MAKVMKPSNNYKDSVQTGTGFYDGPLPPAGVYKGKLAKLFYAVVADGENKGEVHFLAICEITEGQYKGASASKWLQDTEKGAPWLNQFLRSLTDGSDAQFKGIRDAWWDHGYEIDDSKAIKGMYAITKIGKKTNPVGMPTTFMTKIRNERCEITRFISKVAESDGDGDDSTSEDSSSPEDDLLSSIADDDSNEENSNEDVAVVDISEDEDPWSVGG